MVIKSTEMAREARLEAKDGKSKEDYSVREKKERSSGQTEEEAEMHFKCEKR